MNLQFRFYSPSRQTRAMFGRRFSIAYRCVGVHTEDRLRPYTKIANAGYHENAHEADYRYLNYLLRIGFSMVLLTMTCSSLFAKNIKPVPTLCNATERVVFSCPFKNGKIVSLCASSDLSIDQGTLHYLYGVRGKKPELIYPSISNHPSNNFWYGEVDAIFPERASSVGFTIDEFTYMLTISEASNTGEYLGILSMGKINNKRLELKCPLKNSVNNIYILDGLNLLDPIAYRQSHISGVKK